MNNIQVLYDFQAFVNQFYGGISRYYIELFKQYNLNKSYMIDPKLLVWYSNNEYLQEYFGNKYCLMKNVYFKGKTTLIYKLNQLFLYFSLKKNFNVFHPTYYDDYFLKFLDKNKLVITIYDMMHEIYPNDFKESNYLCEKKKNLMFNASKIIAISNNTAKDIIKMYPELKSKIKVVYLASSLNINNIANLKLPSKYILFIGERSIYKNFQKFLIAISELLLKDKDLYLVCAGGRSFSKIELNLFSELKIMNKINYYKFKNDSELSALYKNASLFVFPSCYEGFGIPVLEAMRCKCPISLSNCSSFPEIAEDTVTYFDPYSIDSIKNTITIILSDSTLKKKLVEKAFKKVQDFSWENTALKTKEVYLELLK